VAEDPQGYLRPVKHSCPGIGLRAPLKKSRFSEPEMRAGFFSFLPRSVHAGVRPSLHIL